MMHYNQPTPEELRQILKNAATLIRAGHTTRAFARNSKGLVVDRFDETAVKFCAAGAIARAAFDAGFSHRISRCLAYSIRPSLVHKNDTMLPFFRKIRMAHLVENLPVDGLNS